MYNVVYVAILLSIYTRRYYCIVFNIPPQPMCSRDYCVLTVSHCICRFINILCQDGLIRMVGESITCVHQQRHHMTAWS